MSKLELTLAITFFLVGVSMIYAAEPKVIDEGVIFDADTIGFYTITPPINPCTGKIDERDDAGWAEWRSTSGKMWLVCLRDPTPVTGGLPYWEFLEPTGTDPAGQEGE